MSDDDDDVHFDQRKRSIDSLQRLYTIVVGLAITEALRAFLGLSVGAPSTTPTDWSALPWRNLAIFFATLIPFYHGANGHLDQTYLFGNSARAQKRYALLGDFVILFIEGGIFVLLALSLKQDALFLRWFYALLFVDVGWAIFVLRGAHSTEDGNHAKRWMAVNAVAIALVFVAMHTNFLEAEARRTAFVGLAVMRTGFDYWLCWSFYVARYPMPVRPAAAKAV